jgi:parallel beta-helix repeat protein
MRKTISHKSTVLKAPPLILLCLSFLLPLAMQQHAKADTTTLVRNVSTDLNYVSIQEAIDAPQTLEGHMLLVNSGVYSEHLEVHKSVKIVGSDAEKTFVDGGGSGTVVHINASNVLFSGFTVRNGGNSSVDFLNSGIFVDYCENVTISNNTVTNCRYGVYVFHSAYSRLIDNNVSMNYEDGVWLYYSRNNILERNTIRSNKYNFGVFGQNLADFNQAIDTSNLVDNKPIRYEIGLSNKVFDCRTEAGTLYLINVNNVTVRDLHLSRNGNGLFLWNATNSKVENVTVSDNNYGIFLQESNENMIRGNNCPNNWVGIFLENSDQNSVKGNSAPTNEKGISLYDSNDNLLEGNTVSSNLYGIRFFASSSNKLCHNNVIKNTKQIDLVNSHDNDFDDGSEGNFWSDYTGLDMNEDGVGDSTHDVGGEQDRYPLMGRFTEFEVQSNGKAFLVSMVSSSLITGFSSKRTGEGNTRSIEFNVTSESENQGFCRMSFPTALLRGPYVVKTCDLSWYNITFSTLPSTNESCALLHFKYDNSVHSIEILGIDPNPSQPLEPYLALTLILVFISVCLVLYLVARRRIARTRIVR